MLELLDTSAKPMRTPPITSYKSTRDSSTPNSEERSEDVSVFIRVVFKWFQQRRCNPGIRPPGGRQDGLMTQSIRRAPVLYFGHFRDRPVSMRVFIPHKMNSHPSQILS